jgi:hypothetical protein
MHSLRVHDFRPRLMHFCYSFMFVLKGLYLCVKLRINTYFIITIRPRVFKLKFETFVILIDEKKITSDETRSYIVSQLRSENAAAR